MSPIETGFRHIVELENLISKLFLEKGVAKIWEAIENEQLREWVKRVKKL